MTAVMTRMTAIVNILLHLLLHYCCGGGEYIKIAFMKKLRADKI